MIIKFASCLLAISLLGACQTTTKSAATSPATSRQTLSQRMIAQNTTNPNAIREPAPPAEGPEDIPAEGPVDPNRNPGLLPTPLLRTNAASGL